MCPASNLVLPRNIISLAAVTSNPNPPQSKLVGELNELNASEVNRYATLVKICKHYKRTCDFYKEEKADEENSGENLY